MLKKEDIIFTSGKDFYYMEKANVHWLPNRYCNYSCSYCFPGSNQKVKDFCDREKSLRTIDLLCEKFHERNIKEVNWGWSGGEPTFHPNFLEFLERCVSNKNIKSHTLSVTTNLSQTEKWWKEFIDVTKYFRRVGLNASLHQEYIKGEKSISLFEKKLDMLTDNGVFVSINQVMDPDLWDDQKVLMDYFISKGYNFLPKINTLLYLTYERKGKLDLLYDYEQLEYLKSNFSALGLDKNIIAIDKKRKILGDDYRIALRRRKTPQWLSHVVETEDSDYFLAHAERLKSMGFHDAFKDFICSAGYLSVNIDDEVITRGTSSCSYHVLGKIGDEFDLLDKPTRCGYYYCSCSTDLKLPKWKPGHTPRYK